MLKMLRNVTTRKINCIVGTGTYKLYENNLVAKNATLNLCWKLSL